MNIRTTCRFDRPDKDKNVSVIFELYDKGKYFKIPARETVNIANAKAWDRSAQGMNARFAGADLINRRLSKKKAALISIIDTQKEFNIELTRTLFERYLDNRDGFDMATDNAQEAAVEVAEFYSIIENLIEERRNKWSAGYIKRFRSLRTKILDHDPEFIPEKFSID